MNASPMNLSRRSQPLLLFVLFAAVANVTLFLVLRHDSRPLVKTGCCIDLLVSIPAAYYWLVIRAGAQPAITLVPVFLAGLLRATYISPLNGSLRLVLGAICEMSILWFVIRRGRRSLVARIAHSELSVLRYGLTGWWMRVDAGPEDQVFTMHKTSGVAALFAILAGVSLGEAALAHFIVQHWSPAAAWILTAISIYGAVLLIALARAFLLRPILVGPNRVVIRCGLLWCVEISRTQIIAVQRSCNPSQYDLKMAPLADPNVVLRLDAPVIAEGLYGRRRTATTIALAVDDAGGFLSSIAG